MNALLIALALGAADPAPVASSSLVIPDDGSATVEMKSAKKTTKKKSAVPAWEYGATELKKTAKKTTK